ncbi:two-component sensor histidine kinase [Capnocytophaga canimorsus]|uniref:histidine kinase n=1 Tax=Capnocytophaga canimorsus TaxID=28188 RepID=A0A250G692_9FLAO|nr:ATP-binding protein [Capnocytophaga canimorsus]ATA91717.1 two-component sensor histidine kinase [Capnocytophaga canimorsus]
MLKKNSLRLRIFLSMALLMLVAFSAIAAVMVFQYRKQSAQYHQERLIDKENQIHTQILHVLKQTTYPVETNYIPLIFRQEIFNIANIQNVNFNLFDLSGNLLKSSSVVLDSTKDSLQIPEEILRNIAGALDKRYAQQLEIDQRSYQESYSYVNDPQFKPIAILNIPNFENDTFIERNMEGSLYNLLMVYFIILIVALSLAYFMSKYITKSLKTIEKGLEKTRLLERNEKIILDSPSAEIGKLVAAYNGMIDEIERSKVQLAKSEREQAWREMAKQVAHEIKNPLTPMRLSVQSFQRKFSMHPQQSSETVNEFCESIIQQIDIMSNIASAFSAFTNMPAKHDEHFDLVPIVKRTLDIFNSKHIDFVCQEEEIVAWFDKDQIARVVTNLVKNAVQATAQKAEPKIRVTLLNKDQNVELIVTDNGTGIAQADADKIFEPKFTTKSSGSGLGLAIVKNIVESHGGKIQFHSVEGQGSTFFISFPKSDK